jgi:hypothetical protein
MFKAYRYQIYLILIVLLAYWPFTFFISSLLHDNIDVALPTKYYASECLSHGFLPLWNPFQLWGFPAHADLQYTNWNIETLLVGTTVGYNYYILHGLFIFYTCLASIGMYNLAYYLSKRSDSSFFVALIYILSGIVIAHTQSLVTILGIVFLPYVFVSFFKWLDKPELKTSILFVFFFYLLLTMGYQAFAFMIIPIFLILFLLKIITLYKLNDWRKIKYFILWASVIVLLSAILFLPILISQLQSKEFVNRLNGMSVNDVMDNPFPILGLSSLLNPLFTIGHDNWFHTEITMRNVFVGTIPLILIGYAIFKKQKSKVELVLLFFAFLYFTASLGDVLPIRKLLYYSFPGFNLFRFPSLLRVVVEICLLCLLAINLDTILKNWYNQFKICKQLFLVIVCLFILIAVYLLASIDYYSLVIDSSSINTILHSLSINVILGLTLVCQAFILLIMLFKKHKSFKDFKKTIYLFSVLELTMLVSVYGQYTSFSEIKPSDIQSNFSKMSKGFPYPSEDPIEITSYKYQHLNHVWKNTGAFKKQLIVNDPWTSFYFSNYNILITQHTDIVDSLNTYPFIYFSKPKPFNQIISIPIDTTLSLIRNSFYPKNTNALNHFISYSPEEIKIAVALNQDAILNLQQSFYTGWNCFIDDVKTDLFWNAGLLMSVKIPKGTHIIQFKYDNSLFKSSLILSYGLVVIIILVLIWISYYQLVYKLALSTLIMLFVFKLYHKFNYQDLSLINHNKSTFISDDSELTLNENNQNDVLKLFQSVDTSASKKYKYRWHNSFHTLEFWYRLGIKEFDNRNLYQLSGEIEWSKDENMNHHSYSDSINIIKNDTIILNNHNPYTKAFAVTKELVKNKYLVGSVFLKAEKGSAPIVACVLKNKNQPEKISYFELRKYISNSNNYLKIPYYFELIVKESELEYIKLFVMNNATSNVVLKDIVTSSILLSQPDRH